MPRARAIYTVCHHLVRSSRRTAGPSGVLASNSAGARRLLNHKARKLRQVTLSGHFLHRDLRRDAQTSGDPAGADACGAPRRQPRSCLSSHPDFSVPRRNLASNSARRRNPLLPLLVSYNFSIVRGTSCPSSINTSAGARQVIVARRERPRRPSTVGAMSQRSEGTRETKTFFDQRFRQNADRRHLVGVPPAVHSEADRPIRSPTRRNCRSTKLIAAIVFGAPVSHNRARKYRAPWCIPGSTFVVCRSVRQSILILLASWGVPRLT